jgi:hypothetical protein
LPEPIVRRSIPCAFAIQRAKEIEPMRYEIIIKTAAFIFVSCL